MTAEELKTLRTKAGLTQTELAEKIGTHKQVISAWENGRSNISKPYVQLLLLALKS